MNKVILCKLLFSNKYLMARPGVDKVKPKVWFKYSVKIG